MNASVDAIKNFFKMDPKQLDYYKQTQLEKKAVDIIIEKGNVTEVEPEAASDGAPEDTADDSADATDK